MVKVVVKWRTCDDGLDGCDMLVQDGTVVFYGNLASKDGILVLNGIVAQIGTLVLNDNWNGILVWGASGILVLDGIGALSQTLQRLQQLCLGWRKQSMKISQQGKLKLS